MVFQDAGLAVEDSWLVVLAYLDYFILDSGFMCGCLRCCVLLCVAGLRFLHG